MKNLLGNDIPVKNLYEYEDRYINQSGATKFIKLISLYVMFNGLWFDIAIFLVRTIVIYVEIPMLPLRLIFLNMRESGAVGKGGQPTPYMGDSVSWQTCVWGGGQSGLSDM